MLGATVVIPCALSIVLALVAVWLLYFLWLYIKDKLADPYTEGRVGFWQLAPFEKQFVWHTLGGFRIAYKLIGSIERIDNEEFKRELMLEGESRYRLIEQFNNEAIQPHLQPAGAWFFIYGWVNYCEPYASTYKTVLNDDKIALELDPNAIDLKHAIADWQKEQSWRGHGCIVDLMLINMVMSPRLIEENYNMLTPEQLASVEQDKRYLLAEEQAVVAALKRRLEITEPGKVHENGWLAIEWTLVDQAVRIKWEIDRDARQKGFGVKGFRQTGGFYPDKWSDDENGTLVVDSVVNDSTIDHPSSGASHFYTFMLVRPLREGRRERCDSIRFQVRIPEKSDVQSLRDALKTNSAKRVTTLDPMDKRISQLLKSLNVGVETDRVLMSMKKTLTDEIKAKSEYSPREKKELIEQIEARIEAARIQLFS